MHYLLASVAALLLMAPAVLSQEAPKLLPFQGRLTDAQGSPVADGSKLILFEIYDVPTGGNATWPGEMHKTTVNGGLVNVLLGSKSPFGASSPDFNKTLYLQITIDSNGDNAITSADPPLLPRQVILPAVFAKEAADSRKLGGLTADDLLPAGMVVVSAASVVPDGWLPCDGREYLVQDHPKLAAALGARYGGDGIGTFKVPNLGGRTIVGAGQGQNLTLRTLGETIGEERHLLTAAESGLPAHKHPITDQAHAHNVNLNLNAVNVLAAGGATSFIAASAGDWITSLSMSNITGTELNAAQNAQQSHNVMQPSMVLHYIIKR